MRDTRATYPDRHPAPDVGYVGPSDYLAWHEYVPCLGGCGMYVRHITDPTNPRIGDACLDCHLDALPCDGTCGIAADRHDYGSVDEDGEWC